jgi:hypothetical protein
VTRTDLTVVYRTSNRERPEFEYAIQATLLKTIGDLPVISVSQHPIALGTNICVGDVGISNVNTWRQLQIGLQAATTPYVCTAEADFLHAPDYFAFVPPRDDVLYIPEPIYVLFARKRNRVCFWPKIGCQGAVVADRLFFLSCVDKVLDGFPQWSTYMGPDRTVHGIFPDTLWETFHTASPTITFKTNEAMHERTQVEQHRVHEVPYWGSAADLLDAYHCERR